MNIAIIGAGIGGLCLAQGLKKNGISFQIFERDLALNSRRQGYRLRIDQTGQEALRNCLPDDLYHAFSQTGAIDSIGVRTIDPRLDALTDKWVDSWSSGEADAVPDKKVNRLTLREIMFSGLDDHIAFGKEFVSYQELTSGMVQILFKDGYSYEADVLVAADGIHSRLCQLRFPDNQWVDTGNVNIYGRTFYTPLVKEKVADVLQSQTTVIFDKGVSLIVDAMRFSEAMHIGAHDLRLSPVEDYIYWAFIGNAGLMGLKDVQHAALSGIEIAGIIGGLTDTWAPSVKALFELADLSSLSVTPVRTSMPKDMLKANRVTVLGDAIHAMSPAGGLGANTALFDAALLTQKLSKVITNGYSLINVIGEYEAEMLANCRRNIDASQRGGERLYGDK